MRSCAKSGITIEPHMTSLDISIAANNKFKNTESNELRDIYIKVRYGEAEFGRQEAQKARNLLRKIFVSTNRR